MAKGNSSNPEDMPEPRPLLRDPTRAPEPRGYPAPPSYGGGYSYRPKSRARKRFAWVGIVILFVIVFVLALLFFVWGPAR
jgi:hypothetical protein